MPGGNLIRWKSHKNQAILLKTKIKFDYLLSADNSTHIVNVPMSLWIFNHESSSHDCHLVTALATHRKLNQWQIRHRRNTEGLIDSYIAHFESDLTSQISNTSCVLYKVNFGPVDFKPGSFEMILHFIFPIFHFFFIWGAWNGNHLEDE